MRAGIVATLARTGRHSDVITPGRHPVGALPPPKPTGKPRLLVVDQAEELFSLCPDIEERERFAQLLADHAEAAPLVLVLRADRMGDVSAHPALARLVERGLYVLAAMTADELRTAIEGPARQAGLIIEPGLVDLLVREVENEPGALPLLSHALRETWLRREGRTLTVAGYQASGGIRGAVAQSAEQLYGDLEPGQRKALHDLLLRLVSPGTEGEPVRARVPRRQVVTAPRPGRARRPARRAPAWSPATTASSRSRTKRSPAPGRGCAAGSRTTSRANGSSHHLSVTADTWNDPRPPRQRALPRRPPRPGPGVAGPAAPRAQRRRDRVPRRQRRARRGRGACRRRPAERQKTRLIRRLRIVLAGALRRCSSSPSPPAGTPRYQQNQAEDAAETARQAAVSADARRVGARSQLTDDISLSLLLAAAGVRLDDAPETRVNLSTALAKRPNLVRSAPPGGGYIGGHGRQSRRPLDRDLGRRPTGCISTTPPPTGCCAATTRAGRPTTAGVHRVGAFSPDSTQLAVIVSGEASAGPVRLLDPDTMQPTTKLDFPGRRPVSGVDVQFSADGRYLAATVQTAIRQVENPREARAYAVVWDLRSPSTPPVAAADRHVLPGAGAQSGRSDPLHRRPLTAYDVATGKQIWRREDLTSYFVLDVNAEGTLLALGRCPEGLFLVDAATGETVRTAARAPGLGRRRAVLTRRLAGGCGSRR